MGHVIAKEGLADEEWFATWSNASREDVWEHALKDATPAGAEEVSTVPAADIAREHAGAEFQRAAARGAAVDHLGSLLLLWAACDGHEQAVADELVTAHLEWARRPLRNIEAAGGFYGTLATATTLLLDALRESRQQ